LYVKGLKPWRRW